jgi:multiple sugar transport system substrate-binding protein
MPDSHPHCRWLPIQIAALHRRAAAEVVTKYIITDMYTKAVQGMPAEDAVKWAHGELVKIYT